MSQSHSLVSGDILVLATASTVAAMLADEDVLGMTVASELSVSKGPNIWDTVENLLDLRGHINCAYHSRPTKRKYSKSIRDGVQPCK